MKWAKDPNKPRHARKPKGRRDGVCRKCGCTDRDCSGCIQRTGVPCHWVESDLCSACVPTRKAAAK